MSFPCLSGPLAARSHVYRRPKGSTDAAGKPDRRARGRTGRAAGDVRRGAPRGSPPHKDATQYELRADGPVDRPKTYTLGDPRAMPQTRIVHDALCTDGWRVDRTPSKGSGSRTSATPRASAGTSSYGGCRQPTR
ncbi:hypothetical protein Srubr_28290 [Streptomyces rubradiris]|uniref:Uncharacterized protein n=1 Tax=Streptomyces rubradiris TaxID=285531 RepID=A0ABQ3RAX8_STRRR|nr:hypothetical protein GCM10018792_51170 [Streptomyces rubradiris]GHI52983.1 hypothetical protein Srubr_28290 [Streptomyces rubradiris]